MNDIDDHSPHSAGAADDDLSTTVRLLEDSRPRPSPAFRGALGRSLLSDRGAVHRGARPWWAVSAVYSTFGVVLLAVAAAGLIGAGPFAA